MPRAGSAWPACPGLPVDWTQSLVAKGQGEASDLSWEIHTQTLPVANPEVSLGWKGDADKLDSLREHTWQAVTDVNHQLYPLRVKFPEAG